MIKNNIFILSISVFLYIGNTCYALEHSIDHPVVDSALILKEALDGLDPNCPQEIKNNQTLIDVMYYSTDGLIHQGQIVIDRRLENDIKEVFEVALDEKFPFTGAVPISQFHWSDAKSMAQNNTSGFNYRQVTGGKKLSNHSYGFAIDINPFLNPYIKKDVTLPSGAVYDLSQPGTLSADHNIVKKFLSLGWEWGGNWRSLKDFQHFEKSPN